MGAGVGGGPESVRTYSTKSIYLISKTKKIEIFIVTNLMEFVTTDISLQLHYTTTSCSDTPNSEPTANKAKTVVTFSRDTSMDPKTGPLT